MNGGFKELNVYKVAFQAAMEIFELSIRYPIEEVYSLTDQIRRSSRSVCANIAEAFRKRRYPKSIVSKICDADGEASETIVWLDFSKDCCYLNIENYSKLIKNYEEVGRMLGSMANYPEKFLPR